MMTLLKLKLFGVFISYNNHMDPIFEECLIQANTGDPDAQYRLGMMFMDRKHMKADTYKAYGWFCKSADQGNDNAMYQIGRIYSAVYFDNAVEWYMKSAECGNYKAINYMAILNISFDDHFTPEKAIKLLKRGVELGSPHAKYKLGKLYIAGEHIEKDFDKGLKLCSEAVDQNVKHVAAYLTDLFIYLKDYKESYKWLNKIHNSEIESFKIARLGMTLSLQTQEEFNEMISILDDTYTFPQSAIDWIKMEEKYEEKILFRESSYDIMYTTLENTPKEMLKIIVLYL